MILDDYYFIGNSSKKVIYKKCKPPTFSREEQKKINLFRLARDYQKSNKKIEWYRSNRRKEIYIAKKGDLGTHFFPIYKLEYGECVR